MSFKLVQIHFQNRQGQSEAAQKTAWERAHQIAKWPGLVWKIWIYDQTDHVSGGIYLFDTEENARAYLDSPIFNDLKAVPGIENMSIQLFDVDEARTAITRGPLDL